jgi:ribosomal protein L40E
MRGRGDSGGAAIMALIIFFMMASIFPKATLLIGCGLFIIVVAAFFLSQKCEKCGSRALRHLYIRIDGQPDRRYSYNPLVCHKCGHHNAKR